MIFGGIFNTGRNDNGTLIFGFNPVNFGDMLFRATPLILTGLSVAVAFKTGLFNIGAPGQYLVGVATTLILALVIPTTVVPSFLVWIIAFIGGILAGAIWGSVPGLFKAFLNVNEVITCIMMNWIAANIVTMLFDKQTGIFNFLLDPSGTKNWAYVFKTTHNNVATSKMGLDLIFKGSQVNGGIIIAIIIAILIYIIMNKTTFGYQLKACGSNRNAAKYAGINDKVSTIISMSIAGGLAGAAAALYFLSGNTEFAWETYQSLPAVGFNGIPVALLAFNNPVGVIFSASFVSLLDVNGMQLKYMTPYNEYITSIITAVIVYFSAFSLLIKQFLEGKIKINFKEIFQRSNKKTIEEVKKNEEKYCKRAVCTFVDVSFDSHRVDFSYEHHLDYFQSWCKMSYVGDGHIVAGWRILHWEGGRLFECHSRFALHCACIYGYRADNQHSRGVLPECLFEN